MSSLVYLGLIGLLVSIYELVLDVNSQRFVASLSLRAALIVSSILTKWDPQLMALLMFLSPSTVMIFVHEAIRVLKGFKDENSRISSSSGIQRWSELSSNNTDPEQKSNAKHGDTK